MEMIADGSEVPESIEEVIHNLTNAVYRLSFGGSAGPTGLEALGMSIAGPAPGGHGIALSEAIRDGLLEIAEAQGNGLSDIADAIRGLYQNKNAG